MFPSQPTSMFRPAEFMNARVRRWSNSGVEICFYFCLHIGSDAQILHSLKSSSDQTNLDIYTYRHVHTYAVAQEKWEEMKKNSRGFA